MGGRAAHERRLDTCRRPTERHNAGQHGRQSARSGKAAAGHGGRAVAPDRGDHVQHLPGLGHVVGAEHPGTEPGATPRSRPACPEPLVRRQVERLADEVLVADSATSTGQPVATSSSSRRVSSSECQVFLPKSWVGSTRTASGRTPAATARSARAVTLRSRRPSRRRRRPGAGRSAGRRPPVWLHTRPAPNAAATAASSGSAPAQVSLIRSAPASRTARGHLGPPGVDADHQVRITVADRRDQVPRTPHLLRDVDLGAVPGLDAADVDDLARPRRPPRSTRRQRRRPRRTWRRGRRTSPASGSRSPSPPGRPVERRRSEPQRHSSSSRTAAPVS